MKLDLSKKVMSQPQPIFSFMGLEKNEDTFIPHSPWLNEFFTCRESFIARLGRSGIWNVESSKDYHILFSTTIKINLSLINYYAAKYKLPTIKRLMIKEFIFIPDSIDWYYLHPERVPKDSLTIIKIDKFWMQCSILFSLVILLIRIASNIDIGVKKYTEINDEVFPKIVESIRTKNTYDASIFRILHKELDKFLTNYEFILYGDGEKKPDAILKEHRYVGSPYSHNDLELTNGNIGSSGGIDALIVQRSSCYGKIKKRWNSI